MNNHIYVGAQRKNCGTVTLLQVPTHMILYHYCIVLSQLVSFERVDPNGECLGLYHKNTVETPFSTKWGGFSISSSGRGIRYLMILFWIKREGQGMIEESLAITFGAEKASVVNVAFFVSAG